MSGLDTWLITICRFCHLLPFQVFFFFISTCTFQLSGLEHLFMLVDFKLSNAMVSTFSAQIESLAVLYKTMISQTDFLRTRR